MKQEKRRNTTWRQIVSLCQQDLFKRRKRQEAMKSMRLELARLTQRQAEIEEDYTVIADRLACYHEQWQELAGIEAEIDHACVALKKQQEMLQAEYQKGFSRQQADDPQLAELKQEADSLLAAKQDAEAVIAENLQKKEELTARLVCLSELTAVTRQREKLQAAVMTQEAALQGLEIEKQNLMKRLSLLTEHKPDTYVLLSGDREEQINAVACYHQYLTGFAAGVQRIADQEQGQADHFLNQDMNALLDRINTIKYRQRDLKTTEADMTNELHQLTEVLIGTARDYGWTPNLSQEDTRNIVLSYQNIRCLRNEVNDLLWTAPPEMLARIGLGSQWKKTLFALITKARAMEQQVGAPGTLHKRTMTEFENTLLDCYHLTQRLYEARYKQLVVCGHSLEQTVNQTQEKLAGLTGQLLNCGQKTQNLAAQMDVGAGTDEVALRQRLDKIEYTLRQTESLRQEQQAGLAERQRLLRENGITILQDQAEPHSLESLAGQLADVERQWQAQTNTLAESHRHLAELKAEMALAYRTIENLICEKQEISLQCDTIAKQLAETAGTLNEIKISLATEWINRIQENPEQPDGDEKSIDKAVTPAEAESGIGKIEDIAQDIVARQAGLILLETREWLLPVDVAKVGFSLHGFRRCNLMEEFLMKCLSCGWDELTSQREMAALLHVEEEIIEKTLDKFRQLALVSAKEDGDINELTDQGREVYRTGMIRSTPLSGVVEVSINTQYEFIRTGREMAGKCHNAQDLPVFRHCKERDEQALRGDFSVDGEQVNGIIRDKLKEWYTPYPEICEVELQKPMEKQERGLPFGEVWVYDIVDNQVVCHIWDFEQNAFCQQLGTVLHSLEGEQRLAQAQKIYNQDKCRQLAELNTKQRCRDNGFLAEPKVLENLYAPDGCKAFLQAFDDARETILLIVPCISAIAANEEYLTRLREVVDRGGTVYLGWGNAPGAAAGEEPIPAALTDELQTLVNTAGLPGVVVFYLGNIQHKEMLVDQQYYLLGSADWLSYRGEQIIVHQAGFKVVDKDYVAAQSGYLQGIFLKELERQLRDGWLADAFKCRIWFYALLRLGDHPYIREILAEEAVAKVMALHSGSLICQLLSIYLKLNEYEFGFSRLLAWLVQQEDQGKIVLWLEELYVHDPQAYEKVTAAYRTMQAGMA